MGTNITLTPPDFFLIAEEPVLLSPVVPAEPEAEPTAPAPHRSLFFDRHVDPILRLPKTRFHELAPSDTVNLSAEPQYQKPLKDFLSRGAHLLGDHVTRLSFAGNKKASAAHIFKIIERCPNTIYLDLTATALKAADFQDKQFRDIHELTVGASNSATMDAMIQACPDLKVLNICDDDKIDRVDFY